MISPWRSLIGLAVAGLLGAACSTTSSSTSTSTSPSTTMRPRTTATTTRAQSTTSTTMVTTSSVPTTSSTVPASIEVDAPQAGASVASPLALSGSANVYEAALNAELAAADGTVLDAIAFQATAGTGTWGTFATSMTFPSGHAGPATLTVYSISAKDGSRINQVRIPLTLR